MSATAAVFAYHDVGARCLRVLLDAGLAVRLVVTHRDDPAEAVRTIDAFAHSSAGPVGDRDDTPDQKAAAEAEAAELAAEQAQLRS